MVAYSYASDTPFIASTSVDQLQNWFLEAHARTSSSAPAGYVSAYAGYNNSKYVSTTGILGFGNTVSTTKSNIFLPAFISYSGYASNWDSEAPASYMPAYISWNSEKYVMTSGVSGIGNVTDNSKYNIYLNAKQSGSIAPWAQLNAYTVSPYYSNIKEISSYFSAYAYHLPYTSFLNAYATAYPSYYNDSYLKFLINSTYNYTSNSPIFYSIIETSYFNNFDNINYPIVDFVIKFPNKIATGLQRKWSSFVFYINNSIKAMATDNNGSIIYHRMLKYNDGNYGYIRIFNLEYTSLSTIANARLTYDGQSDDFKEVSGLYNIPAFDISWVNPDYQPRSISYLSAYVEAELHQSSYLPAYMHSIRYINI